MELKMKVMKILVAAVLVVGVSISAFADDSGVPEASFKDYTIGPGDVLEISVWKEDALTKQISVLPDGKINYPLIGEVHASGRTVAQLKKEISDRLVRFVPDPVLSVGVHQVNSLMVYVIGRVNHPGRFVLNSNINVLQALAMAGGLNSFANRGDIKVFRTLENKKVIYSFDYDEVSSGKNMAQNIKLMRGDVVVAR